MKLRRIEGGFETPDGHLRIERVVTWRPSLRDRGQRVADTTYRLLIDNVRVHIPHTTARFKEIASYAGATLCPCGEYGLLRERAQENDVLGWWSERACRVCGRRGDGNKPGAMPVPKTT